MCIDGYNPSVHHIAEINGVGRGDDVDTWALQSLLTGAEGFQPLFQPDKFVVVLFGALVTAAYQGVYGGFAKA